MCSMIAIRTVNLELGRVSCENQMLVFKASGCLNQPAQWDIWILPNEPATKCFKSFTNSHSLLPPFYPEAFLLKWHSFFLQYPPFSFLCAVEQLEIKSSLLLIILGICRYITSKQLSTHLDRKSGKTAFKSPLVTVSQGEHTSFTISLFSAPSAVELYQLLWG